MSEQPPRRPSRRLIEARAPWLPASWEIADAAAIQALTRGDATPDQQRRALVWIVEHCAEYYGQSYRPGDDGRRDTDFAEGKRSVGAQIVKLSKVALSKLRGRENHE